MLDIKNCLKAEARDRASIWLQNYFKDKSGVYLKKIETTSS
jgi:hypothetical protein